MSYNNMSRLGEHYATGTKSVTERQILLDSVYMWYLKKLTDNREMNNNRKNNIGC